MPRANDWKSSTDKLLPLKKKSKLRRVTVRSLFILIMIDMDSFDYCIFVRTLTPKIFLNNFFRFFFLENVSGIREWWKNTPLL